MGCVGVVSARMRMRGVKGGGHRWLAIEWWPDLWVKKAMIVGEVVAACRRAEAEVLVLSQHKGMNVYVPEGD